MAVSERSVRLVELGHWIDGSPVAGSDFEVGHDAPDAIPYYRVPAASEAQVGAAVAGARAALRGWRRATARERGRVLRRAAAHLEGRVAEIAPVIVRESGKPVTQAEGEVRRAVAALEDFAAYASIDRSSATPRYSSEVWGIEVREPVGVAAVVGTWNLPLQIFATKIGAALAAGCTVVLKPSPLAPCSAHFLVEAFEHAGLPTGAMQLVHGSVDTTKHLVAHPDVAIASFTGKDSSGRAVMAAMARALTKPLLELGGKSANIVFADADLDRAVPGLVAGFVRNQGATCTAGTRIMVEREVYDETVARLRSALATVEVGDPYLADTQVGAMRHRELYGSVLSEIELSRDRGGEVLSGGNPVTVVGRTGSYLAPTLLGGLSNRDRLCRGELFGPLAVILPFSGADEAVELANDSDYGLAAGLWSRDMEKLEYVWAELEVGTVYVNSYHRIDGIALPAGGRKGSGFGLEGGTAGVEEFTTAKSIHIPRFKGRRPQAESPAVPVPGAPLEAE
jgi:acyl-CoA reductase-like NAD-dependent aldehyde dehydrogenase